MRIFRRIFFSHIGFQILQALGTAIHRTIAIINFLKMKIGGLVSNRNNYVTGRIFEL